MKIFFFHKYLYLILCWYVYQNTRRVAGAYFRRAILKLVLVYVVLNLVLECCTAVYTRPRVLNLVWVRGGSATKGDLGSRIVITSSNFHFRGWFLAQIVENRETRLSKLFLGPGDNFWKSYDENRSVIQHDTKLLVICDLLVTHHPPSTISKIMQAIATSGFVFVITFSKNISRT